MIDDGGEPKHTAGFQRVVQRATLYAEGRGRPNRTGAELLVATFAERQSHAARLLGEQDMIATTTAVKACDTQSGLNWTESLFGLFGNQSSVTVLNSAKVLAALEESTLFALTAGRRAHAASVTDEPANIYYVGDTVYVFAGAWFCKDAASVAKNNEWLKRNDDTPSPCGGDYNPEIKQWEPMTLDYVEGQGLEDAVCGTLSDGRHLCTIHDSAVNAAVLAWVRRPQ